MAEPESAIARNLRRLLKARGLNPSRASRLAGFGRTYIGEILAGRNLNPGSTAIKAIAALLECAPEDILRDGEAEPPDAERHRFNRERALRAAERALGPDRGAAVFDAAKLIYDVIVEREAALGRPIAESDEEFWSLLDSMARRWSAESR